jgi:hypothetical protein
LLVDESVRYHRWSKAHPEDRLSTFLFQCQRRELGLATDAELEELAIGVVVAVQLATAVAEALARLEALSGLEGPEPGL